MHRDNGFEGDDGDNDVLCLITGDGISEHCLIFSLTNSIFLRVAFTQSSSEGCMRLLFNASGAQDSSRNHSKDDMRTEISTSRIAKVIN
jgi:hypothetical protein